jgi:hypothetical protein
MEKEQHEVPGAVLGLLEEKHQGELDDLLLECYEQKAGDLRNLLLALVEEKANAVQTTQRNFRQRREAIEAIGKAVTAQSGGEPDECTEKQLEADKAQLAAEEQRELAELDRDLNLRKMDREKELTARALERENGLVRKLQEEQLAERKQVIEEKLHGVMVEGLLDEMNEADEEELQAFRKHQEEQLQQQVHQMEEQRKQLEHDLAEELARLQQLKDKERGGAQNSSPVVARKTTTRASSFQSRLQNKQEIKALANAGQQAYDELSRKYLGEKDKQLQAAQEKIEARLEAKRARDEAKEEERREQEAAEEARIKAGMEARREAKEKMNGILAQMSSMKTLMFKGGFSVSPLETFNRLQHATQQEEVGQELKQRIANNVQMEKLSQILTQIDSLDVKIKHEVRTLKKTQRREGARRHHPAESGAPSSSRHSKGKSSGDQDAMTDGPMRRNSLAPRRMSTRR